VGKKVALALLALAASIAVAACGGTQSTVANTQTGVRLPPARQRPTDPHKGCNVQGINSTQLATGECTDNGVQYVVGNYGAIIKLRTLAVTIVGVAVSGGDAGNGRTATPQRDAFVRFDLQVQNRDKVPHRFALGQTMLGIAEDNYLERTDVEKNVDPNAIARANGGLVGPGETLHGDVVFDITEGDYQQIQRVGRFFIWNFGERASAQISRGLGQIGQLRLYAAERTS
jgi:hypothetical protein